ncbi:MAG: hypothetical protein R3F31_23390 [Verrucomicrobiales bacterium]
MTELAEAFQPALEHSKILVQKPLRRPRNVSNAPSRRNTVMRNKAHHVSRYAFSAGERILPDANVWLYLYSLASIGLDARIIDAYANAWDSLLDKGAVACIDPIVISEVINRLLDEEWLRLDPPDPKLRNAATGSGKIPPVG